MSIEVTMRHMNAVEGVQEYASMKAQELIDAFPRIEHIHVIMDMEKKRHIAEVVVQGKNHIKVESRESSDFMWTSIDKAIDKAEKQMRKLRDKVQTRKRRVAKKVVPAGE